MPSQLKRRLDRLLDSSVAHSVNAVQGAAHVDSVAEPSEEELHDHAVKPPHNTNRHWSGATFGQPMPTVQSIMIHGTSGWMSHASADNFRQRYQCVDDWDWADFPAPAHWKNDRAIGPQYFVDPNGTIHALVGPKDLEGVPLFTWHSEAMSFVSLGIENSDGGDSGSIVPADHADLFRRLAPGAAAADADLAGMQVYALLHPGGRETADLNLIWFALLPAYDGPGDIADMAHRYTNWKNTLFTERDYRSLALLCRFVLECNGIPRNFPLLPYASSEFDTEDATLFRKLILADPLRDQIAAALGLNMPVLQAGGKAFAKVYAPLHARLWSRFFGTNGGALSTPCFRGTISHLINGHHRCPGPLFDWHRFAREVWDWWWYPFDFEAPTSPGPRRISTLRRPYAQARGDTPLIEYYFDAIGTAAEYDALKSPLSAEDRFSVSNGAPVYAMANGVAVAAQLGNAANPGFLLVRHEVFHQGGAGRIDYDLPPTYVWLLISFLLSPDATLTNISANNPDWLNRFVMRLKECELAVAYHVAHPVDHALTSAWGHAPRSAPGAVARPSTGAGIERDAVAYRVIADELTARRPARLPIETDANVTTVRVLLGDFIGTPGNLPGGAAGIQVEIFSSTKLDVPGAVLRRVSASGQAWWSGVTAATRTEALLDRDADLPADGMAWQYPMTAFLKWVNETTWASEWPKYGADVPMPRPHSRTNF
jgi:N-acetylmuramoyl-L-alanine amidase